MVCPELWIEQARTAEVRALEVEPDQGLRQGIDKNVFKPFEPLRLRLCRSHWRVFGIAELSVSNWLTLGVRMQMNLGAFLNGHVHRGVSTSPFIDSSPIESGGDIELSLN